MKRNKGLLFLFMIFVLLISSVVVYGQEHSDIKWVGGPKIIDSDSKKIEVYGALNIPDKYKGNTKVKLVINGAMVNPNKDGTFSMTLFKTPVIEIKIFTGKEEIIELKKIIKYVMDKSNVNEVIKLINELPATDDITLADKDYVRFVSMRYAALLPEEQDLVSNYNLLAAAEKRILELKEQLQAMISEAEMAIAALPSLEDVRIPDKNSVLAAVSMVENVKEMDPNAVVVGEELLDPLLGKIAYLENELADSNFTPEIYMVSPDALETFAYSDIVLAGYVTNVKYLDQILIDQQIANVEYVENAEVVSEGIVVYTGPAFKFSKTLTLEDNAHAVEVEVISQSGKSGTLKRAFYVDTTAPELSIVVKNRNLISETAILEIKMTDMFGYLQLYEMGQSIFEYNENYPLAVHQTFNRNVSLQIGENVFEYTLVDRAGNFTTKQVTIVREVVKAKVQISLLKDSSSSQNKIDFTTVSNFYIKNKETGIEYRNGSTPWNGKERFVMNDIPVGEYTIHADLPDGMFFHQILLGDAYKETIYDAESNPLVVIDRGTTANYVTIILKSNVTLKEIKPLETLIVPSNISYNDFMAALPKHTTIVASNGVEYQVDLKWDVRPFSFDSYKKPGTYTLWSDFFTLPVNVSNTIPATRLEVTLKVTFQ